MKKILMIALMALGSLTVYGQVGIGTLAPSNSAELEVKNSTKGVLLPRVNLTSLTTLSPIVGTGPESLIVYNLTVNSGASLDKGFYYWTGTKWERIINTSDVVGIVINNFSTIIGDTNVLNEIIDIILANGGNVYYDGTTLTYLDALGVSHVIDLSQIVADNETITTLVDNGNGTFSYTNEAGTVSTINYTSPVSTDDWKLAGNSITAGSFLGTTNNQALNLKTNNIQRVTVKETGEVGVGITSPSSSFQVEGSVAGSITSKTANYTATSSDYTVVYKHTTAATLTLPTPSSCTGRKYLIINNGSLSLTLSPGIAMGSDAGVTQYTTSLSNGVGVEAGIIYGNRLLVQSDGTEYIIIK